MTIGSIDLRDKAENGYPLDKLESLIRDCEEQPAWRDRADLACAYIDGDQMTADQIAKYRAANLEPRVINLVGRVVRTVLGTQARNRRDPQVEADDDNFADVADVIGAKLKEARRETYADMAESNAYGSQVGAGIGWVEVSRNSDLLGYKYRVNDVHRSEIWWDWRAKDLGLSDARWLCRRRWMDFDDVAARMPEFKDILEQAKDNWAGVLLDDWMDERWRSAFASDRRFNVNRSEWIDGARQRIKLYEVWYRVPKEVLVFRVKGGEWRRFDEKNPRHMAAAQRGLLEIQRTITQEVRMAIFAGPFRLVDRATKRRRFPYIPFFAFRTDKDNTPYGLVDGMIPAQDEYTEVRMRVQWMRKAQQLLIDNDALDIKFNTIQDIAESMMRPDMVAVLNSNRKNAQNGMMFRNDMTLQKEQYEVMQDSKSLVQEVPGVYSTQLGDAPAGVTSGLAINSLVEQGAVAMGELNDNTTFAIRLVNEALMDLIVEDLSQPNMAVSIGQGSTRRQIMLNSEGPNGEPLNMVADAPVRVGLSEVPASPAFRMQQAQQLAQIIGQLGGNPQAVAVLTPSYIESSNLSNRQQVADDLRRVAGLPVSGDRQGAQQWQQAQQEQAMKTAQAQEQAAQADGQHKQALAAKDVAQARFTNARAQQAEIAAAKEATTPSQGEQDAIAAALEEAGSGL